jgi:hypothetical protein
MPDTAAPDLARAYPLSSTQLGMLFHSRLAPEDGIYTEQISLDMPEDLRVDLLREALQRVLARHELLRTSFHADGTGTPCHRSSTTRWCRPGNARTGGR